MPRHTLLALLLIASCRNPSTPWPASGFTDGNEPPPPPPPPLLVCPGENQCPCGSAAVDDSGGETACPGDTLLCGPARACTQLCRDATECTSGVSGETCLGGRCAVPCDPSVRAGGCPDAGMPNSVCLAIEGVQICGYAP